MIRILHLIETGGIGGAEMVFLQIAREVDSSQFEMTHVLMRTGWLARQLDANGIKYLHIPSSKRLDVGFTGKLSALARDRGMDMLHAHLPDANAYGAISGKRAGVRVLATYHGLLGSSRSISHRLKTLTVKTSANHTVAVSTTLRQQLIELAGFSPRKVSVIHNGVDWSRFVEPVDADTMRSSLGLMPQSRIVGMIGNMRPAKGYPVFVQAAALVAKEVGDVEFLLVGERDQDIATELRRLADELGISQRLHFAGARDDVAKVLAVMDVFALSSLSEGMSIATVEAMGAGVPVVVTRCGGPEDLVDQGETGLIVEPGDPQALAEGILELLRDREYAARMAHAGRKSARARFDISSMVRAYENVYRQLMTDPG